MVQISKIMHWFRHIFNGLGIGAVVYLSLVFVNGGASVSRKDVLFVFIVSCFIGISTFIFKISSLNFLSSLILYYLGVVVFIILLDFVFGTQVEFVQIISSTTIIYLISYVVTIGKFFLVTKDMNEKLKQLNNKLKSRRRL
ncbi:DUF3021 family protein [Liquorilactobacillus satsumensis]|uniref:DUF3021 family protein n=1 Tax=Liquorilactobacillus satsumensis TaxID=259059 RepID=UPI0039EBFA1D|nr:DUF3021 family protein [Liquorilactobacillus satsumensis]